MFHHLSDRAVDVDFNGFAGIGGLSGGIVAVFMNLSVCQHVCNVIDFLTSCGSENVYFP